MIEKKVENTYCCSSNLIQENNYESKLEEKDNKKYSLRNKIHLREIFYIFKGRYIFPDRG